jgi:Amidohydrolase family
MSRLVLRGARWPGDVAVEDGRIVAVGSVPEEPGDEVVRVDGDLVTAGLVNTHHHFYQWMTRGRAVGCDLFGWLTELYPVWARLSAEDVHAAALVALAELALTGCTTAADHHYVVPASAGWPPASGPTWSSGRATTSATCQTPSPVWCSDRTGGQARPGRRPAGGPRRGAPRGRCRPAPPGAGPQGTAGVARMTPHPLDRLHQRNDHSKRWKKR